MEIMDGGMEFEDLVEISQGRVLYVLEWNSEDVGADGKKESFTIVVLKRSGGCLLALPQGFLSAEELSSAEVPGEIIGPSHSVVVQGVVMEDGVQTEIGAEVPVLLVDMDKSVANYMRLPEEVEDLAHMFLPDDPFAFPRPDELGKVFGMAAEFGAHRCRMVSNRGDCIQRPRNSKEKGCSKASKSRSRWGYIYRKRQAKEDNHGYFGGILGVGVGDFAGVDHPVAGGDFQAEFIRGAGESKQDTSWCSDPAFVVRPSCEPKGGIDCEDFRFSTSGSERPGFAFDERRRSCTGVRAGEGEEGGSPRSEVARAMLAQSSALTTLVAHLAGSQMDPMQDLQGVTAGTRGASGRAKLQAELASQKGLFFHSVVMSMARRMSPTTMASGITGVRYLERFGGYGKQRDLGLIQYQLMVAFDFLMSENWEASKDTIALLIVMIEQSVLDSGRFDLGQLLTLQEDPPQSVFTNRQLSSVSRARAFSPLADQRWVTVALAFLKELGTISSKRVELIGQASSSGGGGTTPVGAPKAKGTPKKKGRGKGKQEGEDDQAAE